MLSNLERESLLGLASSLAPVEFKEGAQIVEEGQQGNVFYILEAGEVSVTRRGIGQPLATLGVGEYFGEIALMTEAPRTSTVVAKGSGVRCLTLDRESFQEHFGGLKAVLQREQARRVLSEIRAYKDMNPAVMQRVLDGFKLIHCEPGGVVVAEGQPWSYFCIILEGVVQVCNNIATTHYYHIWTH